MEKVKKTIQNVWRQTPTEMQKQNNYSEKHLKLGMGRISVFMKQLYIVHPAQSYAQVNLLFKGKVSCLNGRLEGEGGGIGAHAGVHLRVHHLNR